MLDDLALSSNKIIQFRACIWLDLGLLLLTDQGLEAKW